MIKPYLLKVQQATFGKYQAPLFKNINWEIKHGETWAITGPSGAGKTTLAEALIGKYPVREGQIDFQLKTERGLNQNQVILVSFRMLTAVVDYKNFYYQQRYNSSDANTGITVQNFLSDKGEDENESGNWDLKNVSKVLRIADLLSLEVIKLSNGQTRKMLLARALLQNPQLLILDNPYGGLDVETRKDIDNIIRDLITHGTQIILITNQKNLPACVTHVLHLQDFMILGKYTRQEYLTLQAFKNFTVSDNPGRVLDNLFSNSDLPDFKIAVKFEDTQVVYDNRKIVADINWTIKKGEKWALTGPNGSGKTTLLSLINGDNTQAFANKITIFDRRKGSGESIWDIKKRIGFVSPELHLYFRQDMAGEKVVATGFLDTLYVNRRITSTEEETMTRFFISLNLEHLRKKRFLQMSAGEQRLLLIIRSLIKNPPLLIWDEPFQGLSSGLINQAMHLLKAYATPEKTIILVSHYAQEIPDWVSKKIELKDGRINEIKEQE